MLAEVISEFAQIKSIQVKESKQHNEAFIWFEGGSNIKEILKKVDGMKLYGKMLKAKLAKKAFVQQAESEPEQVE